MRNQQYISMTSLSAWHLGLQLQILTEITVCRGFFLFEKIWKIEDFKPQGSFWLLKIFLMERRQKNILWPVKSKQKDCSYKVNVSFLQNVLQNLGSEVTKKWDAVTKGWWTRTKLKNNSNKAHIHLPLRAARLVMWTLWEWLKRMLGVLIVF